MCEPKVETTRLGNCSTNKQVHRSIEVSIFDNPMIYQSVKTVSHRLRSRMPHFRRVTGAGTCT